MRVIDFLIFFFSLFTVKKQTEPVKEEVKIKVEPTIIIKPEIEKPIYNISQFAIPLLKPTNPNKNYDIWFAENYQDYIQDTEIVHYFSSFVNENLKLPVTWYYQTDLDQFGKEDHWQYPDYYITHNLYGDCDDFALLIASVCQMKRIPYRVVSGYLGDEKIRDWICEYKINNIIYIAQANYGFWIKDKFPVKFKPYMMFSKTLTIQNYNIW